ncbi:MlaD family protein [Candidatus Protofrankia californiensis]|uniref:MlaD family protein n=1 Tax=Candidatus Protofrankia californiensis TaxID=1839754 RepID=UPI00104173D8|nr:MlaD family protein [Candidatus Protofrankia californiensis]
MISMGRLGRLVIVVGFLGVSIAVFVYFLVGTETRVPIVESGGHKAAIMLQDIDNLVPASRVEMAGIKVGEVRSTTQEPDGVRVEFAITDPNVVSLHQGVTVRVGARSIVEDSYLDVTDGHGAPLPDGAMIPSSDVRPSTQLDDVLRSLGPQTRQDLGSLIRSVGEGTQGTQQSLDATVAGLGDLGRQGHTALDAIAAQSEDLRRLGGQTETLLRALDTGEGQIATLVSNGERLTTATAGQLQSVEETVRILPGVLDKARTASGTIGDLASALGPVAANLKDASPFLSTALNQLPATTQDLRGLLPALSGTLDLAPATLDRVPTLGTDVRNIVPDAREILRDANPVLAYAQPYGLELAAFFANFNAVLQYTDEKGVHYARLLPHINLQSVQSPLNLNLLGTYNNPLPPPGSGAQPGPFTGKYPRVERAPE